MIYQGDSHAYGSGVTMKLQGICEECLQTVENDFKSHSILSVYILEIPKTKCRRVEVVLVVGVLAYFTQICQQ